MKSNPKNPQKITKNPSSIALPKNHQQKPRITKIVQLLEIRFKKPKQQKPSHWIQTRPSNQNKKTQNQIQNLAGPPIPASPKHQGIRERNQHKRECTSGRQRSAAGEM
jgi:hypothetical protein